MAFDDRGGGGEDVLYDGGTPAPSGIMVGRCGTPGNKMLVTMVNPLPLP